jgi:hypothetical protein
MFASKSQFGIAELIENGLQKMKTVLTLRSTSTTRYEQLHTLWLETDSGFRASPPDALLFMSTDTFFRFRNQFGTFCRIFYAPVARIIVIRYMTSTRMLG